MEFRYGEVRHGYDVRLCDGWRGRTPTDRCRERVSFDLAVRGEVQGSAGDLRRMTSCAGHLATVLSEMVGKYTQEWVRVTRR